MTAERFPRERAIIYGSYSSGNQQGSKSGLELIHVMRPHEFDGMGLAFDMFEARGDNYAFRKARHRLRKQAEKRSPITSNGWCYDNIALRAPNPVEYGQVRSKHIGNGAVAIRRQFMTGASPYRIDGVVHRLAASSVFDADLVLLPLQPNRQSLERRLGTISEDRVTHIREFVISRVVPYAVDDLQAISPLNFERLLGDSVRHLQHGRPAEKRIARHNLELFSKLHPAYDVMISALVAYTIGKGHSHRQLRDAYTSMLVAAFRDDFETAAQVRDRIRETVPHSHLPGKIKEFLD